MNPLAGFLHAVVSLLGLNRPTPPPDPIGALLWGLVQQVAAVVGVAPRAGTPTVSTPVATTGLVAGTLGFTDSSGQPLTYTYTGPTNGTVAVSADGAYSYTPTVDARLAAAGGTGPTTDTFTVTAFNGIASAHETVTVPISPDIPVAGTATTSAPNSVTGAVSGGVTASDPAGRPLTYSITTGPSKGTITQFDPVTGKFTYTPTKSAQLATEVAGVVGADTFTVAASNGAASATVTVHVVVDPGHPQAGVVTIDTTDPKTGIVTGTAAFTDPAGGQLVYSVGANPSNGKVVVHNDGTYTYTPNADTTATADAFAITVSNGVHSTTQTVSVPIAMSDVISGVWNVGSITIAQVDGSNPYTVPVPDGYIYTVTITKSGGGYIATLGLSSSGVTQFSAEIAALTKTSPNTYTGSITPQGIEDAKQEILDRYPATNPSVEIKDFVYTVTSTVALSDDGQSMTLTALAHESYTIVGTYADGTTFSAPYEFDGMEIFSAAKAIDTPVAGTPVVNAADPDSGVVTGAAVFTDPAGAELTYSVSTSPTKGAITEFNTATGEFTYTPDIDATGIRDTFVVTATNGVASATEIIKVPVGNASRDVLAGSWQVTGSYSNGEYIPVPADYGAALAFADTAGGYTVVWSVAGTSIEFGTWTGSSEPLLLLETGPGIYSGSVPSTGGSSSTLFFQAYISDDGETLTFSGGPSESGQSPIFAATKTFDATEL